MMLKDKVCIVTGGDRGLGFAAAKRFVEEGGIVFVCNRNEESGKAAVEKLKEIGGEAYWVQTDVSKEEDVKNYVNIAMEKYGRIDVLFNNAGIEGTVAPTGEYPVEDFDKIFSINLRGTFMGMHYVLPIMQKQGKGRIINTSSIGGLVGHPNFAGYCATKFGVIGATKAAALEYSKFGISVNAICPGATNTEMIQNAAMKYNPDDPQQYYDFVASLLPIGRMGEPYEIGNLVCFLASDQAPFLTGAAIAIDGCQTAI